MLDYLQELGKVSLEYLAIVDSPVSSSQSCARASSAFVGHA